MFSEGRWQFFSSKDGLPPGHVATIVEDSIGNVWIGSSAQGSQGPHKGGVSRYDGTHWVIFGERDGLPEAAVSALYADSSGRLWAGFNITGTVGTLAQYSAGSWHIMPAVTEAVQFILEDSSKRIWVVGSPAVTIYDKDTAYTLPSEGAPPDPYVSTAYVDSKARLWIGTNKSIAMYGNGSWQTFLVLQP